MNIINWRAFTLTFIPIFVAIGPLGTTPIFISLTEGLTSKEKAKVIKDAVITAFLAVIAFLFIGKGVFALLGITVSDFMVAGGILLLIIAITILLDIEQVKVRSQPGVGIVPLGTPLLAGPAVFTTTLILSNAYGMPATVISFALILGLTGFLFFKSSYIIKKLGGGGTKAVAKITALLLAAIAVMLIRKGIVDIIEMAVSK